MRCEEARTFLVPADEPRIADRDVLRAIEHAERCSKCAAWIQLDRRMAQLIRETFPRDPAPQEVRERVYSALARERAGAPAGVRRWRRRGPRASLAVLSLAAALTLVAIATLEIVRPGGARQPGTVFVEDYLRKMVETEEIVSSDPTAVAAFLTRELGVPIRPPVVPGAELKAAEICLVGGRRGALLKYTMGGRELSYYAVRGEGRLAGPKPSVQTVEFASAKALRLVLWSDGEFDHAVLSDLPPDYLLTFAHAAGGY